VTAGGGTEGSSYGTDFQNNIFYEVGDDSANTNAGWYYNGMPHLGVESNTTVTANYNFVCGTNSWPKKTGVDDWQHWAITGQEVNGINGGDPGFADVATWNFRLLTNSILLGAGNDLSALFTTDFLGNTRSAWDIGPFEGGVGGGDAGTSVSHTFQGRQTFSGRVEFR